MSTKHIHQNGSAMHFDIIVPEQIKDQDKIFKFGKQHVKAKGAPGAIVNAARCQ